MNDTAPGPGVATCPRCGTDSPLPIHYGYPEPQHIRAALEEDERNTLFQIKVLRARQSA